MTKTDIRPIHLKDYTPPPYLVDTMEMSFELDPHRTNVTSKSSVRMNPTARKRHENLVLDGENLKLISLRLDGQELDHAKWTLSANSLTLHDVPEKFELTICTEIDPTSNKALEGLFMSGGRFCTQCEAEGFRRITYYLDRPDVLAKFTVRIIADVNEFPVLLSNGNCIDRGLIDGDKHYAVWKDPFPKPCYLFALVAGRLSCLTDTFTTTSDKQVSLNLYVEAGKEARARYAMDALKRAMDWDERIYGLEYDLSEFNIVAVSDFNMGAMENKSLNIFNDKFILADPDTATDTDYAWIESVVAHEYFHNWTGNRVTCRDWFQLSLKEGLTVFRDQQFSADQRSAAVQRIEDVKRLRNTQFVEDSGPLAHSVRPESYAEINNFYTHTVYEKGAEVVRMIHTLVGGEHFRKGIDLYFERHDGQAVTCEEFVSAIADASGFDLDQFLLWYKQAGTPIIDAKGEYSPETGKYSLTLTQSCPTTPGQPTKKPMQIPIAVGFVDAASGSLETFIVGSNEPARETHSISVQNVVTTFQFKGLPEHPETLAVSLNRGFTAPIKVSLEMSSEQLGTLVTHDPDPIARWSAAQELASIIVMGKVNNQNVQAELSIFESAIGEFLDGAMDDPATTALLLDLPSEKALAERDNPVDPIIIHDSRRWLKRRIGELFYDRFARLIEECRTDGPFTPTAKDSGLRALRSTALIYMVCRGHATDELVALSHYQNADNLTDRLAALRSLNETSSEHRRTALDEFENRYSDNELVLDKWFMLEASYSGPEALGRIQSLLSHPGYNRENPNRIRALIGTFAMENTVGFHSESGKGYEFVADQIISIDKYNPQSAARVAGAFQHWKRYGRDRGRMMRRQLQRILDIDGLSNDVSEIVEKSLGH